MHAIRGISRAFVVAGAMTVAASAALSVATPRAARAEDSPAADALFREGRRALERGDWAAAAARLGESQRLEPATGTLLNLAMAEDKLGRLASAWEHARAVIDQLAPSDDRTPLARDLFASLDRRVPRLVLRASAATPLPERARVRLDDVEMSAASLGVALPVDPGTHRIVVDAPGHAQRALTVDVREGSTSEQTLEPGPAVVTLPPTSGANAAGEGAHGGNAVWRTVGFVGLGIGGAALATGAVTGVLAIDRNDTVQARCQPGCDAVGLGAASDGRTFATVSTVTVVAGAAITVGAALVLLLVPSHRAASNGASVLAPAAAARATTFAPIAF